MRGYQVGHVKLWKLAPALTDEELLELLASLTPSKHPDLPSDVATTLRPPKLLRSCWTKEELLVAELVHFVAQVSDLRKCFVHHLHWHLAPI